MKHKSVLVVGDFVYKMYEQAFYDKFKELGVESLRFEIKTYLNFEERNSFKRMVNRFQYKFNVGPSVYSLNKDLLLEIEKTKPDIVFFYRGKHIFPNTLKKIKHKYPLIKLYNYNNDDPFSLDYPKYFWKYYIKGVKFYDHVFCYRRKNIEDLNRLGVLKTSLLMPYYIAEDNYQHNYSYQTKTNDFVFIGHFENDGRDEYIKALFDRGFKVRLYGTGWNVSKYHSFFEVHNGPIERLNSSEYNDVLNDSKIALIFMSKKNNDDYTRRCFEIPATGAMMFAEYTKGLSEIFEEDKEIVFFNDLNSFVEKADFLITDLAYVEQTSKNAKFRLINDKHELVDRAIQVLSIQ